MWKWWFGIVAVVVVSCLGFGLQAENLLLGWIYFPARVASRITVDWPSVIIGAVSVVLFVLGLHATTCWFRRSASIEKPSWSWRGSVALSLMIFLLFASGTAMVGATHQTIWLASGRQGADGGPANDAKGLLAAAVQQARDSDVRNDLKQFAIGAHNYHDMYQSFAPGGSMNENGELLHGWAIFTGPFYGIGIDRIDFAIPWNRPPNDRFYKCSDPVFVNMSLGGSRFDADGYGLSHFAGNIHVLPIRKIVVPSDHNSDHALGLMNQPDATSINLHRIADGTAHTLMIGTVAERFKPWGHPANLRDPARGVNRSPEGFGGAPSAHGAQFAMCDGSVRFVHEKTDPRVLAALATPAGGEEVELPPFR